MKRRRQLTALAIAVLTLAAFLHMQGCAVEPPRPFPAGAVTNPPAGCETLRERGGEC
jgi:hypothetical protein